MVAIVLLPGAASTSWYWHRVVPILESGGHEVVGVDLPVDDDEAGLDAYREAAVAAVGRREHIVVVAQSMGAFTAPLVAATRPVERLVLVAPMVPTPGETAGQWWTATGQAEAARAQAASEGRDPDAPFDPHEIFLHDVPGDLAAESIHHVKAQSDRPFCDPWPLHRWPDVPTHAIIGTRDRLFPAMFQRRVLRERLGLEPIEVDAGHLPALSKPAELARIVLDISGG